MSRVTKILHDALHNFNLQLEGLTVLTEAASGNYQYNCILAAMAGAKVFAVTKDSSYGLANDIKEKTYALANMYGVSDCLTIISDLDEDIVKQCDIITNSGFVRPINQSLIYKMKPTAVVPLMWETWEIRENELDLNACKEKGILVLGTDESQAPLQLYYYVGHLAMKLLYNMGFEGFKTNVLLLASNPMGKIIKEHFDKIDVSCTWYAQNDASARSYDQLNTDFKREGSSYDMVLLAEHAYNQLLIGEKGILSSDLIKEINPNLAVGIIAGNVDVEHLKESGLSYFPDKILPFGYVSYDTYQLGPKPVIDLYAAGLQVGEIMAKSRLSGKTIEETVKFALSNSMAMDFQGEQSWLFEKVH